MGVVLPFLGVRHTGSPHALRGGGLVGQREGVDSEIEQMLVEAIETAEEQCRLLESVNDEATAEQVAPRYAELVAKNQRVVEQLQRRNANSELGIFGNIALKLKYDSRVDRIKERLESGTKKIRDRPELQVHFARHVPRVQGGFFAGVAPGPGPQPGMPAGPPPGFGRPPAAPQAPAPAGPKVAGADGGMPLQPGAPQPPDSDALGQILINLKSSDLQRRKDALARLMRTPVDDARRVEVAGAIEPMLKDPDGFGRSDAAKALAVWGGPENTPALAKALKDPEFGVRWAVLDTFKALHDPAGADAVADALVTDRGKAAEALRAMGPGAEPAVMKYLNHSDGFVRMEVCRILQEIGTKECVPALYDLLRRNNGHGLDCMAATDALKRLDPDGSGFRKAMKKTARKR
jgi:hypothetical protein